MGKRPHAPHCSLTLAVSYSSAQQTHRLRRSLQRNRSNKTCVVMDGRTWNASSRGHDPAQHASPAATPSVLGPGPRQDPRPQQQQHQQQWYPNHAGAAPYASGSSSGSSGSSTPLGMQWPSHASSLPAHRTQPQPEQTSQFNYNSKMGYTDEQQQYKQLQLAQHQARMLQQSLQQQQQQQQQAAPTPTPKSYYPYVPSHTHGNRAYTTPSNSSPNTVPAFRSSGSNTGSSSTSSRVSLSDFSQGLSTGGSGSVLHGELKRASDGMQLQGVWERIRGERRKDGWSAVRKRRSCCVALALRGRAVLEFSASRLGCDA